jgi:hypothetical protein
MTKPIPDKAEVALVQALQDAVNELHCSLASKPAPKSGRSGKSNHGNAHQKDEVDTSGLTPEEEVLLLHIME